MDKLFCCRITCYKKEKQRDFFRENARVFIIICMFALKKHMQYWARLIFFLFKKRYIYVCITTEDRVPVF